MHANLLQFCLTLCNLIDCRLVGSCAREILQASILEWVVMSSSRGSYWHKDWTQVPWSAGGFFTVWAPRDLCIHQFISVQLLCRVRLLATPWIAARQASLSITNSQSSPKLMCVELVMSSHLILCPPLLLLPPIPPSIRVFSNESTLCMRWPKYCIHQIRSDQISCSVVSDSVTPWIAAHQASLSITNCQSSLRLTSIESVMPSSHLILCRPLLLLPPIPPSIRVFSNESTLLMRWPKYWSFSFSIISSKETPGPISPRMDWLDLLAVQGTLKSLLQHHISKASILRRSAFFTVQLSHPYMTTGKTIALTRRTFVGKVMSQLLNMLSRLIKCNSFILKIFLFAQFADSSIGFLLTH